MLEAMNECLKLDVLQEHVKGNTKLVTGVIVIVGTNVVWKIVRWWIAKRRVSNKIRQKQKQRAKAFASLRENLFKLQLSPEKCSKITDLSFEALQEKLNKGELKPTAVLHAYQMQALKAQDDTNCLVEPIREAQKQAEALDNASEKGPLYGIPVSIKDNFCLKGYDSTIGCSKWIDKPFREDNVIVQVIREAGGIPFVKTNIPQTMISWETTNPIYGETRNPHDKTRGVGGSSGGEGALLASKGSMLGFGSDIGGSVRIPSAFCGVYTLKPTAGRISAKGTHPLLKGQRCCPGVYGPMTRDVESLVAAYKVILSPRMHELDPTIPSMPFNSQIFNGTQPLKIGYYTQDGFITTVPAVERCVMETKRTLESLGHEVVEWKYNNLGYKTGELWAKSVFGDGGKHIGDLIKGDQYDISIKVMRLLISMGICTRTILGNILKFVHPKLGDVILWSRGIRDVSGWWDLHVQTAEFRTEIMNDWRRNGFDVVICPGFPTPALPFGYASDATPCATYTQAYNVLNFPSGTIPISKVTAQDEADMKNYPDKDFWHRTVKKGNNGSTGLPIGVQVISFPWQEEVILRVMKEIQDAMKQ